jgi:molecular chaperone DnaJ
MNLNRELNRRSMLFGAQF